MVFEATREGGDLMSRPVLSPEEQQAMDALLGVMNTITRAWGMTQNAGELASAIHVVQGFIIQHMLHRLAPEEWSSWETPATSHTDEIPGARGA